MIIKVAEQLGMKHRKEKLTEHVILVAITHI